MILKLHNVTFHQYKISTPPVRNVIPLHS